MNNSILLILYAVLLNTTQVMSNNILQWNCRGFSANFEEISVLIDKYKPVALCLQETFLSNTSRVSLKHHSIYQTTMDATEPVEG